MCKKKDTTPSTPSLTLALLEPSQDIITTFTAVVAAQFNIGPGLGEVGATMNFAHMGGGSMVLLSFLMALGRLELFAVLVLFVPSLWRRYR